MLAGLHYMSALAVAHFPPLFLVAAAGGNGDHGGTPHLPSLVWILHEMGILPEGAYQWATLWVDIVFALLIAVLFTIVVTRVYRKRQLIPGPLQNFIEMLVEGMYNFLYTILGKDARKYTPFLGTLFFYILAMNWIGLIPGGHSPSTSLNITASLAIMVFLYAQYTGIRRLGILGYIDHMAGEPRGVITWCMVPLLFPLHIIGEAAKPFSLSLRLFGNITGEDVLIAVFVGLGIACLSFMNSPVGLPLHLPFIFLGMLLSTIQALVFTLLSTIYILMMLPHEEHDH
ncbi:MAG: F0F1 ATP synthase subunit A [candidate division Zixibacteria bacterium]|nr:F0F1 ATP synthase subunit A [candidate division Zixibacteria bacterium]